MLTADSSALKHINLRTAVKRIVMLSATKHLGSGVRCFAEFTLSEANILRMTHQEVAYLGSCILGTRKGVPLHFRELYCVNKIFKGLIYDI